MLSCFRRLQSIAIRPNYHQIIYSRTLVPNFKRYADSEDRWRKVDGVPDEWELIYKSPIDKYIGYIATFSTVSPPLLVTSGLYYYYTAEDLSAPIYLENKVIIASNFHQFQIYVAAYVVLHIAVKILISRFVIRMYQKENKYLAVFKGHLQSYNRLYEFDLKDFKRLKMPWIVSWGNARFSLGGGRKAIILSEHFKTPAHFNVMLRNKDVANN